MIPKKLTEGRRHLRHRHSCHDKLTGSLRGRHSRSFGHRRCDERGAVLVEMAVVGVVLITLMLGTIEFGFAWRESTTVHHASRSGARVAAGMGLDPDADRQTLKAIEAVLGTDKMQSIEYIVVFKADEGGEMPPGCETASGSGCNHYTPDALAALDNDARWGCGAGSYDSSWCPGDRRGSIENVIDVGIAIKLNHQWTTGFFTDSTTDIDGSTIMRLQPGSNI